MIKKSGDGDIRHASFGSIGIEGGYADSETLEGYALSQGTPLHYGAPISKVLSWLSSPSPYSRYAHDICTYSAQISKIFLASDCDFFQ